MFPVPKELERLTNEIDGWLDLRCPDKALELVAPLLDHAEARPAGLWLRVRAYTAVKQHKEALRDLAELRTTSFDPEWLDLTEAWCQKRVHDLPAAVRCMEQLLERNPKSSIGHFNLGCYLALAGERERALDEVTLACGLDAQFRGMLLDEPDLASLQRDPRFKQLLAANQRDADPAEGAIDDEVLGGFGGTQFADETDETDDGDDFDDSDDEDLDDDEGPRTRGGPHPG